MSDVDRFRSPGLDFVDNVDGADCQTVKTKRQGGKSPGQPLHLIFQGRDTRATEPKLYVASQVAHKPGQALRTGSFSARPTPCLPGWKRCISKGTPALRNATAYIIEFSTGTVASATVWN